MTSKLLLGGSTKVTVTLWKSENQCWGWTRYYFDGTKLIDHSIRKKALAENSKYSLDNITEILVKQQNVRKL